MLCCAVLQLVPFRMEFQFDVVEIMLGVNKVSFDAERGGSDDGMGQVRVAADAKYLHLVHTLGFSLPSSHVQQA